MPEHGPLIFVANHTSAFMDPILLAVHIKRPVYFLARGEAFKSKLASVFFNWLHMIPIFRPEISPDEVHKNEQIFQRCFDHLSKGKTMMIFPEGFSKTERRLRPLKTGAARIGLGAEDQHDFNLGVTIMPIGINYSNPHYFRSDVYVKFGDPIHLENYKEDYKADPFSTAQELTETIKVELERLTVIVSDKKLDQLVNDIERFYRSELRENLHGEHKAAQDFYLSREIVKAVTYYKSVKPRATMMFQEKISNYLDALSRLHISDAEIRQPKQYARSIRHTLYFVLGLPIFLYGFIVNILPYQIVKFLSRKVRVRKDFIGSMKLAFGMFIFLIFYILLAVMFSFQTKWYWGLLFVITLYPSGLFCLNYIKHYYRRKGHMTYGRLYRKRKTTIQKLRARRKKILDELESGRQLYLKQRILF
ncbi:MAG: hypothetical protein HKO67_02410 [Flavobacteriaceae bacterium]|nr:hypothetical protein [Flavobacteriaceae bacterium]